jgi:hypothetical protein
MFIITLTLYFVGKTLPDINKFKPSNIFNIENSFPLYNALLIYVIIPTSLSIKTEKLAALRSQFNDIPKQLIHSKFHKSPFTPSPSLAPLTMY